MSLHIYLSRHGQDEDNANGILNGRRDTDLTQIGLDQAEALASQIKKSNIEFDLVFCSPLRRAQRTAEVVSKINELPQPIVINDLMERDYGLMTGRNVEERLSLDAGENVIRNDVDVYCLDWPESESFPALLKRAEVALKTIRSFRQEGSVLIVCHGEIGKMLYAAIRQADWRKTLLGFQFENDQIIDTK